MLNEKIPQWVAVKTMSRHEKVVHDALKAKEYEVYLPLKRELRKRSDRKTWVQVPLISTYVFCKIIKKDLFWVNNEKSVSKVVEFGGSVAIVSEEEIEAMKLLVNSATELYVKNMLDLRKGKKVRILSGECEGLEGYIINDCKDGNFAVKIESLSIMIQTTIEKEYLQIIE